MPCLIVNLAGVEKWDTHHSGGARLPVRQVPTVLHSSSDVAEAEALRLAARFPGHGFVVFKATVVASTCKVPTHVTLGGKVVAEQDRAMLIDLADDPDALPF